ncbi:phospholipase A2, partial [Sphaerisporangium sp. NPDC051017]|uniref:phospholipase A2 n=1 Tax=Sphaerisporangium sp. NPDC051017 TaxID=3154636 RepID=UPI0034483156
LVNPDHARSERHLLSFVTLGDVHRRAGEFIRLVLQSPTETASTNYRVFASAENTAGLQPPVLEVTSNEVIAPGEGDDPADPGPAPSDLWPGRVDPDTGVWITSGTDAVDDGLIVTRSHTAGQRMAVIQPNENVLGPNWRLEALGGLIGDRLHDYSASGYIQIKLATGKESQRFVADVNNPGTFIAEDGSTVAKNADGTLLQTNEDSTRFSTWSKVGQEYLITSTGTSRTNLYGIAYDGQGRVSRLAAAPMGTEADCSTFASSCASIIFRYATTTTATSAALGDIVGQLKALEFVRADGASAGTVVTYSYDSSKALRQVQDLRQIEEDPIKTSSYDYDAQGNITKLSTAENGTWSLTYAGLGKLASATKAPAPMAAGLQSHCIYASQYMWGTDGCWVSGGVPMDYGATLLKQKWMRTPGGKSVVGVENDHCTFSVDRPGSSTIKGGFDFTRACDMHDYGYGVIYWSKTDKVWTKAKKGSVDAVFYTTLRDYTCNAYPVTGKAPVRGNTVYPRKVCQDKAAFYYQGVKNAGGFLM